MASPELPNHDDDDAALALPRSLGRHQLLCEIGRGGMAAVYLARSRGAGGFERMVAVKLCRKAFVGDERFRTMFLDEARLAARIHHMNVAATFDVVNDDELYLVLEYIEGGSLSQLLKTAAKTQRPLPSPIALRIVIDALNGLHAAHECRDPRGEPMHLIHRDVSPQNILVGADGIARIVDFGIAKAAESEVVTRTGELKGKMDYMSPEQLAALPMSRTTDVFSTGIVLWESLAGRRLFGGGSVADTVERLMSLKVPSLSTVIEGSNAAMDAAIAKALSRDAGDRFATALEFADAIEAADMKIATARETGAFVKELLSATLEKRRERVLEIVKLESAATSLAPGSNADADGRATAKPATEVAASDDDGPEITTSGDVAWEPLPSVMRPPLLGTPKRKAIAGAVAASGALLLFLAIRSFTGADVEPVHNVAPRSPIVETATRASETAPPPVPAPTPVAREPSPLAAPAPIVTGIPAHPTVVAPRHARPAAVRATATVVHARSAAAPATGARHRVASPAAPRTAPAQHEYRPSSL